MNRKKIYNENELKYTQLQNEWISVIIDDNRHRFVFNRGSIASRDSITAIRS